jgi:SAM-dependent methyltransferase
VGGPWELEAENWVRWARTPKHDAYWDYAPIFFDEMVPAAGRRTLELGCGEGRVVRDLTTRGHRVVGLDASPTLLGHAREADPSGRYVLADAARVPFADDAIDLVVAYNSLMDIEHMEAAVREAARVLETTGRLCVCVTHPVNDAGVFASREPDAAFVIDGSYLDKRVFEGRFERDGLEITFHGWTYPLEAYGRALEDAGFVIEAVREPPATAAAVAREPSERRWQRLPMFLFLRAIKR